MNKKKGFSLLEILVAFSILAIALTIILKIFSSGVQTAMIAEKYTIATQIAESLMAKTGVETPLVESESDGITEEIYHWQIKVTQLPEPLGDELLMDKLLNIQVLVAWGESDTNRRFVELNTVRLGSGSYER